MITIEAQKISKDFDFRTIFEGISISVGIGQSLAITGRNGSGKSTLMKILCGLLSPSKGNVVVSINEKKVSPEKSHNHLGFVAPYLTLYEEFTGYENLSFIGEIRGHSNRQCMEDLLHRFGLFGRHQDEVRKYSSGMKQRLKYAAALLHRPEILLLDEPQSNLDVEGITVVHELMAEQRQSGILILATNDQNDLRFADTIIRLEDFQSRSPYQKKGDR